MARQRHFINTKTPGLTVFATTRALDFAHIFRRMEVRDALESALYFHCRTQRCKLHAYVIMVNHIHFVMQLREDLTVSEFMKRFKPNSSSDVGYLLTEEDLTLPSMQTGLNRNSLWERSFRAFPIMNNHTLSQKIGYTHDNPVRAKLVSQCEDYRHSSARLFAQGLWHPDTGLPLDRLS